MAVFPLRDMPTAWLMRLKYLYPPKVPAILTWKALTVAALARWPLIGQFAAQGIEGIEPITEANNREFKQFATAGANTAAGSKFSPN